MTSRRGIFFNSKSRLTDKLINPSPPIALNTDPNTSINTNISTTTTTAEATTVKKKIVLNPTKRSLAKTNYSGPRKIFSTDYKVNYSRREKLSLQ